MIKIGFTGDFCPRMRIENEYKKGTWKELFTTVRPFFNENNLNIIDLECPLTNENNPIVKTGPHIKSIPQTAEILSFLNCSFVATANNHFKDYGSKGMEETYNSLTSNGIDWVGSGRNYEEASETKIKILEDVKFAFINIAENEWSVTYGAEAGCHPLDTVNVFNRIKEVREKVDFVIVIVHGGHEHYNLPSPRMKKWYRFFVDAGADAVVGHHTHIISGYETYKNAPIFYSLGNFCFDWEGMRNKSWNTGMLLRLNFKIGKPIEFETVFVKQNDQHPGVKLLSKQEEGIIQQTIESLNKIIHDDHTLQKAFDEYANSLKPIMNARIQPYLGRILPSLHKRGMLPTFIGEQKKRLLSVLIRCESHRDILLNAIKTK